MVCFGVAKNYLPLQKLDAGLQTIATACCRDTADVEGLAFERLL